MQMDRVHPASAALLLALVAPSAPAQGGGQVDPGRISVDVNLVVLHVSARDHKGDFVSGLRQDDFRVFEDGRPQVIQSFTHEDVPVSLGLVVDNSGSMGRRRADLAAAALALVRSSNPQDEIFIVNFNDKVSLGLPPEKMFSASPAELEKGLNGTQVTGRTRLYDAIDAGLRHVAKGRYDKKALVIISDGGDNASKRNLPQILEEARASNAIIYTIGLFDEHDADQNPQALRKLARATGGEAFIAEKGSEMAPLCERIAADLRHQYTIAYAPSNPRLDRTYRRVRVALEGHHGRVRLRTRKGYIAASASPPQTADRGGGAR